jgi:heterodisulfide reductase subunit A
MTADEKNPAVLVIGAGIAGMAAGMHLAQLGQPVFLLDTAPTIGGSMHLLDHTFPTNSCGLCLMLPQQPALCPTFECDRQPNLTLLPYAQLVALTGRPGNLTATIRHKARFVEPDKCTGCGDCAAVCPETRPHDLEGWMSPVKAIYRPPGLRAVPDTWLIDMETCTRCGECVRACPAQAIDLDMADRLEELRAGAVLLTPGFAPFDLRLKGEYGYQVYDNVLSALEFERLVSLAGSSVAHLARPSDGRAPKRIAFVHCVGSRDPLCGAGHCSSACCMFTAKQVALAKQIDPDLEVTVFFMDLRAFGKDFETYLEAVQALPGVTYRRAMPSSVRQLQQSRDLLLTYAAQDGKLREQRFDLLVLATGFAPPPGMQDLARQLGLELNGFGFARSGAYHPTRSNRPGIFLAGAFREPKDIPDTVAEAAAASAEVAAFLQARPKQGAEAGMPSATQDESTLHAPRDLADEEPKVGVFVCDCNVELSPLGITELAAGAQQLPGVAWSQTLADACCRQGRATIQAAIVEQGLNRVVLAGCSQRLFSDPFETMMLAAGLDPRLLARVNLREQVLYPHRGKGADLTAKARSLVAMAVASLRSMAGLEALALGDSQPLTRRALVIGGGAAGMTAALQLAAFDIPVDLVEREAELGGQWRHIRYQADGSNPGAALQDWVARVGAEDRIRLHLQAEVQSFQGKPGHYRAVIAANGSARTLEAGVLVVASGGKPASTTDYLYSRDPRVLTQRELEQQIADGTLAAAQTVVMVQCAGSREPQRPYCSRVCCTQAIKNALKLKEIRPALNIYILYREVRTYGFREAYYQEAREAGIVFLRYDLAGAPQGTHKPQVVAGSSYLGVSLSEPVTGQTLELNADLLVLSVGIDAEEQAALAARLGVALNGDGFFQEEHPKMKPLDLSKGGIYVAGLAHSPRFLEETLVQAQGAAMRAAAFLAPGVVCERPTSVWVNERLCSFCGLCVEACPYDARVMNYDTRVADVDYVLCQGCGVCAMVCPNKATLQKAFEHGQVMAAIDMALG